MAAEQKAGEEEKKAGSIALGGSHVCSGHTHRIRISCLTISSSLMNQCLRNDWKYRDADDFIWLPHRCHGSFPPNAPYAPLFSTQYLGGFTNTLQRSTHGTGKHCKGVIHPVDSSFLCSTHGAVVHIQQSIVPRKLYKHAPHALTTQWQELAPPPCSLSHGQTRRAGRGGRATQMFSLSNQQPAAHMFSSTPS